MASTRAPITLLRVKRARTHEALDGLHIQLTKRPRRGAPPDLLHFRRLPAAVDVTKLGPSRVIDVNPSLIHKSQNDASEHDCETVLYNGVPMTREFLDDDDECMYDVFCDGRNLQVEHLLCAEDGENVAWLADSDLPLFEHDSDSEDLLSDSDDRSVDYPSTPEGSVECASEDEFRLVSGEASWERCSSGDPKSDPCNEWDADDCESEQDGDNYDYEA